MSSSRLLILAALLTNIQIIGAQKPIVQTITNLDAYTAGRGCMRDCLYNIAGRNGCDNTNESDAPEPVVTPVATEEVVETTIIKRITVEATATATETNFATETVNNVATITRTSFATQVVNGVTTLTSFTGTTTVRVPSSLTQIEYQTFTAVFNNTDSLRQTLDMWGIGSEKGLTMQGKVAVGLGVGMGVFLVAFLVTLCCCLSRRSELMKRNRAPGTGGNVGWPDDTTAPKY
ncbi:hypothetical protein TWF103_007461 [Orbilia oligospora]|nr:hypothetical protein TWF103_007461 [Orbilia oligospora]